MMHIMDVSKMKRGNPHHVLDEIIYRWSPRNMTGEKIPEEIFLSFVDAACYAPSAFNEQPYRFYYAERGTDAFSRLLSALAPSNQTWCLNASYLVILVSKLFFEKNGKPNRTHSLDAGAAWEAFACEATRRNYVAHAMSGMDYETVGSFLKLNSDYQVECAIAVGVPSKKITDESITQRKTSEKVSVRLT